MKKNTRNKLTRFGVQVKKALLERGMNQRVFCEVEGIPESRFSEIIHGIRPGDKYRSRIIRALGIQETA